MSSLLTDSELLIVTERVTTFGKSLQDAHALGHGPGSFDDLSTRQFHDEAIKVYSDALPWSYLLAIADRFHTAARQMTARAAPLTLADEWIHIVGYLRAAGSSMLAAAPDPHPEPNDLDLLRATPAVMPFDRIARLASPQGALTLLEAGSAVASVLGTEVAPNPLVQHEVTLLEHLMAGERVVEIAEMYGYSERTLHRKLSEVWQRLGAKSRVDGLALAAAKGWIGTPTTDK